MLRERRVIVNEVRDVFGEGKERWGIGNHRMKISTGMGFLLRPLLEVLSPLSDAVSMLEREFVLSRRVKPRSISRERFAVGLSGTLNAEGSFECEEEEDFGDFGLDVALPPRWKRVIQDEADGGIAWRDASREERVEEDHRERNVLSEISGVALEGGVVGGVKELEYIPATGLSGSVGIVETHIAAAVGVSTSKSKEDIGEAGCPCAVEP